MVKEQAAENPESATHDEEIAQQAFEMLKLKSTVEATE